MRSQLLMSMSFHPQNFGMMEIFLIWDFSLSRVVIGEGKLEALA